MKEEKKNNRCCLPPGGSTPWLVYTHGNSKSKKFQTFCTISSSPPYTNHYFKSIPELRGKTIFSSNDGWLLLHDLDKLKIFTVWSPISCQLINLPPLNALEDGVLISCALVCPPPVDGDANDVSVFVFVDGIAFSYRPFRGDYTWIVRYTELGDQRVDVSSAIMCDGIIYGSVYVRADSGFYSQYVIIEVTDFDGPISLRAIEAELPKPEFRYSRATMYYLVSCGRVYTVGIYSRNVWDNRICAVNIWELDSDLTKWVRVKDLEGRAFFVGEKGCTWCWGSIHGNKSEEGVKPNSVYFEVSGHENFGTQEALYLYNLEDCSLTSLMPCTNLPSSWYTPTWVMPQYQRLVRDEAHVQEHGSYSIHSKGLQEQPKLDTLSPLDHQKKTEVLDKFAFLSELPFDTVAFIAQKMDLFDYLNFRSTCKEFRSIIPVAQWRTNNLYPILLFFESEDSKEPVCRLMDPRRTDSCYMVIPKLFRGVVHVDFSMNGWLLLRHNEGTSLQFFNPFTKVVGEFPPFEHVVNISSVGFSTCPTSPDCVTVGISWIDGICYHRYGEETWHVHELDSDDEDARFWSQPSSPIYHKGAFYFLNTVGHLGVFKLVDEESVWDVYDAPQTPGSDTFHSSHLVECGGELFSVFIGDMGHWVRVFRFNQKKFKWVRVKSLGNYVLFVGPSSSFSVVANEPEMRNRIFLPRQRGNEILFYALDTGKYGTLASEESLEDFTGTKEHVRCFWM